MHGAPEPTATAGPRNRSILIIDHEADTREIAQLGLELAAGWYVDTAADGPEGVEQALSRTFDAILVSATMPPLDGPATLHRLRAEPATSSVPVIFVSASNQIGDLARLRGLGARGVIRKPFDPTTLAIEIARILAWPDFS